MSNEPERPVTVIVVTNDGMGTAEPALRQKLAGIYLKLLLEHDYLPTAICFYADGVKLVVQGSPVLDVLKQIEAKGVHLVSCVTCLNYYRLNDKVAAGIVGGMHDIVELQHRAHKVITL
jgi:hypothetical protein